jgi:hypothetical protein
MKVREQISVKWEVLNYEEWKGAVQSMLRCQDVLLATSIPHWTRRLIPADGKYRSGSLTMQFFSVS